MYDFPKCLATTQYREDGDFSSLGFISIPTISEFDLISNSRESQWPYSIKTAFGSEVSWLPTQILLLLCSWAPLYGGWYLGLISLVSWHHVEPGFFFFFSQIIIFITILNDEFFFFNQTTSLTLSGFEKKMGLWDGDHSCSSSQPCYTWL